MHFFYILTNINDLQIWLQLLFIITVTQFSRNVEFYRAHLKLEGLQLSRVYNNAFIELENKLTLAFSASSAVSGRRAGRMDDFGIEPTQLAPLQLYNGVRVLESYLSFQTDIKRIITVKPFGCVSYKNNLGD